MVFSKYYRKHKTHVLEPVIDSTFLGSRPFLIKLSLLHLKYSVKTAAVMTMDKTALYLLQTYIVESSRMQNVILHTLDYPCYEGI